MEESAHVYKAYIKLNNMYSVINLLKWKSENAMKNRKDLRFYNFPDVMLTVFRVTEVVVWWITNNTQYHYTP